jgi:hypothetical protein
MQCIYVVNLKQAQAQYQWIVKQDVIGMVTFICQKSNLFLMRCKSKECRV